MVVAFTLMGAQSRLRVSMLSLGGGPVLYQKRGTRLRTTFEVDARVEGA